MSSSFACALSTMSPVTKTACGCSRSSARTAASSTWVENASCGRKVESNGAPRRSRNGTRAGDSSSRTCVSVSWPKVASVRPGRRRRRGRSAARRARARGSRRRRGRRAWRCSVDVAAGRRRPATAAAAARGRARRRISGARASFLPQPRDDGLAQHAARDERGGERGEREQAADDERDLAGAGRERQRRRSPRRAARPAGRARRPRAPRRRARPAARPPPRRPAARARRSRRRRRTRAAARPRRAARARSRSAPGRARTGTRGRPRARRRAAPPRARRGTAALSVCAAPTVAKPRAEVLAAARHGRRGRRRPSSRTTTCEAQVRVVARAARRAAPRRSGRRSPARARCRRRGSGPRPPSGSCDGERRARPQPERVGQPEPDLDLVRPAHAPPGRQRRRLEARVVAGVGDEPERLAEPERVGRVDAVARARRRPRPGIARTSSSRTGSSMRAVSW